MIREFEAFLNRYRAAGAFVRNLGCNFEGYVQTWVDMPIKRNTLVSGAFDWDATEEGWAYWAGIDKQWRDYFRMKYTALSEKTAANV